MGRRGSVSEGGGEGGEVSERRVEAVGRGK